MNRIIFTLILLAGFACPVFADDPADVNGVPCGTLQNPAPCDNPDYLPPTHTDPQPAPDYPQPQPSQGPTSTGALV